MRFNIVAFCFFFLSLVVVQASEQNPTEAVRVTVNLVLQMVDKSDNQFSVMWGNINEMFDFNEISRRTLTHNWKKFSKLEKDDFSNLFGEFLRNTYMNKIKSDYKREKISYTGEELIRNEYAIVKTKLFKEELVIPIDYRLIRHSNSTWKIYDIVVEGVSLISNYRTQFKAILRKEAPAQLIERLRQKLKEERAEG